MPSLWKNHDFLNLWGAQTLSAIGSKVTFLALPLTAVVVLNATPTQMGYLSAIGALPGLLFGLFAGMWADRSKRRRLLIVADLYRGILLLLIPLAAWLGILNFTLVCAVLFCTGAFDLLFGAAYHAYLPSLISKDGLVNANSKMELSRSAAEIVGPTIGGWLIQIFGAPIAIGVDAISYLVSATLLGRIRKPEPPPAHPDKEDPFWHQLSAGLRLLKENQPLLAITIATSAAMFFNAALEAIYLLYMIDELKLSPGLIGVIFGAGSIGFLAGALLPTWLSNRITMGQMLILGMVILAASDFVLPLASGPTAFIVALLIMGQIFFGLGLTIFSVGQVSLRQSITPDHLLGRMNATLNFVVAALIPVGALVGGLMGSWIGLRPTLFIAAAGELLAALWLLTSPIRTLKD